MMSALAPWSLRDWDTVVGTALVHAVHAMSGEERDPIDLGTPVVFECGDLLEAVTEQFTAKIAAGARLLPTEVLNVEGARVFRKLRSSGWLGPGLVVACDESTGEKIAWALALESASRSALFVSVRAQNTPSAEGSGSTEWAISIGLVEAAGGRGE